MHEADEAINSTHMHLSLPRLLNFLPQSLLIHSRNKSIDIVRFYTWIWTGPQLSLEKNERLLLVDSAGEVWTEMSVARKNASWGHCGRPANVQTKWGELHWREPLAEPLTLSSNSVFLFKMNDALNKNPPLLESQNIKADKNLNAV